MLKKGQKRRNLVPAKQGKARIGRSRSDRFASRRANAFVAAGNLSQFEEERDRSFFVQIGKSAAQNAINENMALGISTTYLVGNTVSVMDADGQVHVKGVLKNIATRKFIKGTVLHVKAKKHA